MSTDQQRKNPRVPAPHVMVKISTRERMKSTYLKDLSEGGLFVRTEKPLPVGREVTVDLLPPGWASPLRLSGTVTRTQTQGPAMGMGVQFAPDDAALSRLKLLVSEYQSSVTEAPAGSVAGAFAVDHELQLKQLLERYAELQNVVDQRDADLTIERERREEASKRALELASELEALKTRGQQKATTESPKAVQLTAELSVAQREATELRTRVSELEGELAAYKHELEQLESDETTSRRLAATLGREKTELTAEVTRLSKELTEAGRKGEELALKKEELHRAREEREGLRAELGKTKADNERLTEQLAVLTARGTELDGASKELQDTLARVRADLSTARGEIASLERKVAQLDASAKDANSRAEKHRAKERELRDLLAMVSQRGDDMVMVDDEGQKNSNASGAASDSGSSASVIISITNQIAAAEPELEPPPPAPVRAEPNPPTVIVEPQLSLQPPPPPPPSVVIPMEAASSSSVRGPSSPSSQLSVDVDLAEESPPRPDGPSRIELEQRLRANTAMRKTDRFDGYPTGTNAAREVKGLLEAGGRLSELMVLGRGKVTPPELVQVLLDMLDAGALRFE